MDRDYGAGLNNSTTGSKQFNKLINSTHPVVINTDHSSQPKDDNGVPILGKTSTPTKNNPDGTSTITMFYRNIKESVTDVDADAAKGVKTTN